MTKMPHPVTGSIGASSEGSRAAVHYWKCDRAHAFHGTAGSRPASERDGIESLLRKTLSEQFVVRDLRPGSGQGNHLTWLARLGKHDAFIRVEDGPERDEYMEVEARVLDEVRLRSVPTPKVIACDATRRTVPFAWQALERIPHADLNLAWKEGRLDLARIGWQIGAHVARWQAIRPRGFGPFETGVLRGEGRLQGCHRIYAGYFLLRLAEHLRFLVERDFLNGQEADEMCGAIDRRRALLELTEGCLVHKDLALWNLLGTDRDVMAVIDWDDCISGDPMDDLSLLGCFHDGPLLVRAFEGYQSVRPLPQEHRRRFWLHLLRNMIVKAVIRVGAGYFERGDGFFLIGAGRTGVDLRDFTRQRLWTALRGLNDDAPVESL